MRSKTVLLLLLTVLAMSQPYMPAANAEKLPTELTLYAHTDPSADVPGGRVLSITGNTTSRHSSDVRDGLAFVLVPSLSGPLHILGTISVYVWLKSQESVRGTLRVSISEVSANASVIEIRSSSVTVGIPSLPYLVIFSIGTADHTLGVGSTLKLEIQFSPVRPVQAMLLWDDPFTPTRLVLQVEAVPKIGLSITDVHGRVSTIFPENETGTVKLVAEVSVEDPFRGTNVQMVSLTLTNSSGFSLIEGAPMNLTSRVEVPFRLHYALMIETPSGQFNVTASVRDIANGTFVTEREIVVTRFHTLILMLLDPQKRPLPSLNVSISAGAQLIEEVTTNSSGTATARVPSSRAVGPLTLQVLKGGVVILSRQIEVESDSVLQLETPLYDWNIAIRLQSFNAAVPSATVDVYLNGTFVASTTTDANGVAHLAAVPLGVYEVAVTSSLGSKRFHNVTHSPEPKETVLSIPVLSGIPESTVLIFAAVAIVTVLGAFAATRRRVRAKRFKHVAELLGGAIPASAVMMIVGPSGTGKSLVLLNILADSLRLGRRCVYVSNSELPSKTRDRLRRMGLDVHKHEDSNTLRFIDAYSGAAGAVSPEKHWVPSTRDLTRLGIELTGCLQELGETGDVFFDSLTPVVASGGFERGFDFIEYYGARTTKSGGTFLYVASTTIEPELLSRLEESSDCVLQTERSAGPGEIRGRLLVKKGRDVEHERDWVGFKIGSNGRMEFVSVASEKP